MTLIKRPSIQQRYDIAARARERIADSLRWTTGARAKDTWGTGVAYDSPTAVKWCATGAVLREGGEQDGHEVIRDINVRLTKWHSDGRSMTSVNDHRGHFATIQMFDRYLAELDKREG
jgi:hypothetical protein